MSSAKPLEAPPSFVVRRARTEDEALIFNSWLKSFRRSAFAASIHEPIYFAAHHAVVRRILDRPSTTSLVAVDPRADGVIWGWAVLEPGVLHYVYVKEAWRGLGIARALCASLPPAATVTHRTPGLVEAYLERHPAIRYDPYRW